MEGNFSVDIESDGGLSIDAGPEVDVVGHMSENGDSFTILATGLFDEDACDDSSTLLVVGVKKAN